MGGNFSMSPTVYSITFYAHEKIICGAYATFKGHLVSHFSLNAIVTHICCSESCEKISKKFDEKKISKKLTKIFCLYTVQRGGGRPKCTWTDFRVKNLPRTVYRLKTLEKNSIFFDFRVS